MKNNEVVKLIDYEANGNLSEMSMSFHWWGTAETSLHCHNYYELFIITSGKTYHTLNGETKVLGTNTMYLIRPQDVHKFFPVEDASCIHINISATPERFIELCRILEISAQELLSNEDAVFLSSLGRDEMAFFMNRSQELHRFLGYENRDMAKLIITEMLLQGIALTYKKRMTKDDKMPIWLRDVLEKIHSPEHIGCSAKEVYSLAGYSAPIVIRNFKAHTGDTVIAYLAKLKMDWAMQLFRTTDMTVTEVANRLGYASVSHFSRLFKKQAGLTPRDFKVHQIDYLEI